MFRRLIVLAAFVLAAACGADAPAPPLAPPPTGDRVGPGGSISLAAVVAQALSCDPAAITWSVLEANGGTITQAGVYTAPSCGPTYADGTYHVQAVGCSKSATISVVVAEVIVSIVVCGVSSGATCCAPSAVAVPGGAVTWYAIVNASCHTVTSPTMPPVCP